jgi:hypothetical protein
MLSKCTQNSKIPVGTRSILRSFKYKVSFAGFKMPGELKNTLSKRLKNDPAFVRNE